MLKPNPRQTAVHSSEQNRTLFRSADLDYNYRPLQGLLFSLLVHASLLFGILFLPFSGKVSERSRYLARAVIIDHNKMVLYLPAMGDRPHKGEPEPGSKPNDKSAPVAPAPRTRGLSYPGPQPIVSDFEHPTNSIQTVLQPALPNPAILKPPLLLPNVVQVADAGPVPEAKSPEPSQRPPEPPKPVDQLKVDPPIVTSPVPVKGPDLRNFLALTPMPAVAEPALSPPPGEARGRFAVSPDPNLDAPGTEPGSKGTTAAAGPPAPAVSSGSAAGSGPPSGSDTPSGPGKNVFPGITITGITIIGGAVDTKTAGNPAVNARTPPPLQTSYGITILSSGAGGGGLPNLGVFSNEQVHTAFLDMRRDINDQVPSWTVEYALLQGRPGQASGASKQGGSQLGIVLPFPTVKEQPAMPPELVRSYPGRMVIVYAIINIEGKMEQIVVKDSPDSRLNEPVLNALSKFVFRPAQRDGETVPTKALIGIPVWTPAGP